MSIIRAGALALSLPLAAGTIAAVTLSLAVPREAAASVSLAILFDDLVRDSGSAALVTPVETHSVWENDRIYTYTRVHVDRAVAGELGVGADAWVRTLGGVVGKVGQLVEGEPVLTVGRPAMLFLTPGPVGALVVTGRAQGQFPLISADDHKLKLVRSSALGALLTPTNPSRPFVPGGTVPVSPRVQSARVVFATDALHDRPVDDAVSEIAASWKRLHAK